MRFTVDMSVEMFFYQMGLPFVDRVIAESAAVYIAELRDNFRRDTRANETIVVIWFQIGRNLVFCQLSGMDDLQMVTSALSQGIRRAQISIGTMKNWGVT